MKLSNSKIFKGTIIVATLLTTITGGITGGFYLKSKIDNENSCKDNCLQQFNNLAKSAGINNEKYSVVYGGAKNTLYDADCESDGNAFNGNSKLTVTFCDQGAYDTFKNKVLTQAQQLPCRIDEKIANNTSNNLETKNTIATFVEIKFNA